MTPKVIYANNDGHYIHLGIPSSFSKKYVSVDYLLEWVKSNYQPSATGCYTGQSVWEQVIEHLESL